jgi:hypothetical protein
MKELRAQLTRADDCATQVGQCAAQRSLLPPPLPSPVCSTVMLGCCAQRVGWVWHAPLCSVGSLCVVSDGLGEIAAQFYAEQLAAVDSLQDYVSRCNGRCVRAYVVRRTNNIHGVPVATALH